MLQPAELRSFQKATLEIGSSVVLSALALGLQFGRWPSWAVAAAVVGYVLWVIAYSEATIRAAR
ncbi:MAG TPA: hypothetical protein VJS19_08855 [Candidatus Dormibacteraeota bacterium]|nr:hypothetical protein [Candidatus Dormibacteraeota bacterium]